jgi:hypothetical protein
VGENDLVFCLCEYGGVYLFLFIVLTVLLCMWGGVFVVMCGLFGLMSLLFKLLLLVVRMRVALCVVVLVDLLVGLAVLHLVPFL